MTTCSAHPSQDVAFTMERDYPPPDLALRGHPDEYIPEVMSNFRERVKLRSVGDGVDEENIDRRAETFLHLIVRDDAADAMSLSLTEALEWRSERVVDELRVANGKVKIRAPAEWSEWVDAFTNVFSTDDCIHFLARDITQ